jgi:hypothetical protein
VPATMGWTKGVWTLDAARCTLERALFFPRATFRGIALVTFGKALAASNGQNGGVVWMGGKGVSKKKKKKW